MSSSSSVAGWWLSGGLVGRRMMVGRRMLVRWLVCWLLFDVLVGLLVVGWCLFGYASGFE